MTFRTEQVLYTRRSADGNRRVPPTERRRARREDLGARIADGNRRIPPTERRVNSMLECGEEK